MYDLIIKNGLVLIGESLIHSNIAIKNEKISSIYSCSIEMESKEVIDAKGKVVIPGGIDPHVHIRAPGREDREDFYSGTLAAISGGNTTILEHPIANPPQYSVEILEKRIDNAIGKSLVDIGFYGAAGAEFPDKIKELGDSGKVVAFKTFLHEAPNGRYEEFKGLTMENDGEILDGFKEIAKTGKICAIHAENNDIIKRNIINSRNNNKVSGIDHAYSRPPITEYETVNKIILFARETGARIEFAHISTPEAMEIIKIAKEDTNNLYLETCPHYLFFTEEYLEKYGPFAKCNPPLRSKESVNKIWDYIIDGTVDFIGSDHAPYTYEEKSIGSENIFNSPSGIPCIEMRLPLMINAVNDNKLSLARMVELVSTNPAKIFDLYPQKGIIQVGSDADVVIIDMNEEYIIKRQNLYTKSRDSAIIFDNMKLKGKIKTTVVRGKVIMKDGIIDPINKGWGKLLIPNSGEIGDKYGSKYKKSIK